MAAGSSAAAATGTGIAGSEATIVRVPAREVAGFGKVTKRADITGAGAAGVAGSGAGRTVRGFCAASAF